MPSPARPPLRPGRRSLRLRRRPLSSTLAGLAALPVLTACGITASAGDEGPAVQVYPARS